MATRSNTFAWKIPWTMEPGELQSMGSQRVGPEQLPFHFSLFMNWRRKWQPTPVFLPGESHGQWSLLAYSPWGHKESDTTEQLALQYTVVESASLIAHLVKNLSAVQETPV